MRATMECDESERAYQVDCAKMGELLSHVDQPALRTELESELSAVIGRVFNAGWQARGEQIADGISGALDALRSKE